MIRPESDRLCAATRDESAGHEMTEATTPAKPERGNPNDARHGLFAHHGRRGFAAIVGVIDRRASGQHATRALGTVAAA